MSRRVKGLRTWQSAHAKPAAPGVYPVMKAGYRHFDGSVWHKGSRNPTKAAQSTVVLPRRQWAPWEDKPAASYKPAASPDRYKLPEIDPDAVYSITPGNIVSGGEPSEDTVHAPASQEFRDHIARRAALPPEILSYADSLIKLGYALQNPDTTISDIAEAAVAAGMGVKFIIVDKD